MCVYIDMYIYIYMICILFNMIQPIIQQSYILVGMKIGHPKPPVFLPSFSPVGSLFRSFQGILNFQTNAHVM